MRPTLIHSRQPGEPEAQEGTALDVLLWDGQIEFHQQAAALAVGHDADGSEKSNQRKN